MPSFFTRPLAQQDIQEIIDYYDEISPKLTDSFLIELEQCYTKIKQTPEGYQKRVGNIRAIFLKTFRLVCIIKITKKRVSLSQFYTQAEILKSGKNDRYCCLFFSQNKSSSKSQFSRIHFKIPRNSPLSNTLRTQIKNTQLNQIFLTIFTILWL